MIRTQLLKNFGILVTLFGVLAAFIGIQLIRTQIIQRAESQVRSDLKSAWSVLNGRMEHIETVLDLNACRDGLIDDIRNGVKNSRLSRLGHANKCQSHAANGSRNGLPWQGCL